MTGSNAVPRPIGATGTLYRSSRATRPNSVHWPPAGVSAGAWPGQLPGTAPPERSVRVALWSATVVVSAAVVMVFAVRDLPRVVRSGGAALWLLVALAVLVDIRAFPGRGKTSTVYPSVAFTFALLLGWGLGIAVTVQAAAVAVSAVQSRQTAARAVYSQARYVLSFAAAAGVLALAGVPALANAARGVTPTDVLALVIAGVVWFGVNALLDAVAVSLRRSERLAPTLDRVVHQGSRAVLSLLALSPLVVFAGLASPLLVPLMLVPLLIVGQLTRYTAEEARKASTDELTGLPNRKALYLYVREQSRSYGQRSRRRGTAQDPRRMALLLLDIDQFRRVNEALGHTVGDRLLIAVAQRLREAIGADGMVTRLGGDEFTVLAPRLVDPDAVSVLARRVADALADPIVLDGLPLDITAAVGVAIYPDHGTDVSTLLRHAEIAMYDAKDHSASFATYTPEAEQHSPERLELLADLRRALDSGSDELQLHYQPQVDLATGQVSGAEALLRWHHPKDGFVSPEMLIKVAEHTAIMRRITARVLEDAVAQLAKWRADGLQLRVSVNVSARDLHRGEFVDELSELLEQHGVPANQLQIEITEGALMADPRRVLVTLHRLDRLGVALSLDDFGTGYSSMQHLRRLPLAEVKIDRSFVLGMATDPDDGAIVASVIDLARRLGLRVVAEGVEDDETRRTLLECGCEVGQGWFFARPMPAEEFAVWLARYRSALPPDPA